MGLDWDAHVRKSSHHGVPGHSGLFERGGRYRCDFSLVPHDWLLMKLAALGMYLRVVVWVREFLVGCTQRVRIGGHLSKEVRVTSGVSKGSVLGPLLFLVYVNDVWKSIDSSIRLFADDCIIYRKTTNKNDRKVAEGSRHLGGMGGRKWDENKSQ